MKKNKKTIVKHTSILIFLVCIVTYIITSSFESFTQNYINTKELLKIQETLSSDEYQGRGTGNNIKAQNYIEAFYKAQGLVSFNGNYKTPFQFNSEATATSMQGTNIIGYVKGKKHPRKFIVLSAHYDHLGVIDGTIFNGADDNASGTAAIMLLAKYFSKNLPYYSIIFAAFDAEELGLHGSIEFVNNSPVALSDIVLNINLDMISRNVNNEIYVAGTYQYPQLKPFIEKAAKDNSLTVSFGHDNPKDHTKEYWMSSTDNAPFLEKGIPNLYFGEEDHPDYHQATDDFENIHPIYFKNAYNLIFQSLLEIDQNY